MRDGVLSLGQAEVLREDQITKVHSEPPAPDRDPLEVSNLHVRWHLQSDPLPLGAAEDWGAVVPVLVGLPCGVQNVGLVLICAAGSPLSSNPEESIRT